MKYKLCNEEEKKTESNEYSKIIKKKTEKASWFQRLRCVIGANINDQNLWPTMP